MAIVFHRMTLPVRLAVFAVAVMAALPEARADSTLVRYTVVARDAVHDATVLLVRAIVDGAGAACPSVVVDGSPAETRSRANPDPDVFPVTVCEAVAPLDGEVTVGGAAVPTMAGHDGGALRLAVLGDSGCKGGSAQDCATAWPLPEIAAAAAAEAPDLVIHVGDYDYLGTPARRADDGPRVYDGCVPDDPVAGFVSLGDLSTWATWRDNVFTPAAPLLAAAPWVALRGNHELCSRGGIGWFYLLDPHSPLLDPLHGETSCDAPVVTTAPYALSVGGLDLVLIDSSDACDAADWQSAEAQAWQARELATDLRSAFDLVDRAEGPVWLLSHRPFWAATEPPGGTPGDGNDALQAALSSMPGGVLPPEVAFVLSGHVHGAQALTFSGSRPPQLIAGNGGVALDDNAAALPVDREIGGMAATGWAASRLSTPTGFGYLSLEVADAAHWQGAMAGYAPDGTRSPAPLVTCAMPVRDGELCVPGN